jgi:hypothetical protein
MQLYVNAPDRRAVLDEKMLTALPSLEAAGTTTLSWRSPLQQPLFAADNPLSRVPRRQGLDALTCARSGLSTGQDARSDGRGTLWPATPPAPWSGQC